MDHELAKYIVELGDAARKPEVLADNLRGRTLLIDGAQVRIEKDRPLRKATLTTFRSLIDVIQDAGICPSPEVYVSRTEVRVFPDRDDRHEKISLTIAHSAAWQSVSRCAGAGLSLKPKDAIRWLRHELQAGEPVAAALAEIEFVRSSNTKMATGATRDTMGRQVDAAVKSANAIATEFIAPIRFSVTPGLEDIIVDVIVFVELNFEQETVSFIVRADDLAKAGSLFEISVGNRLRSSLEDSPCLILIGTPA